MARVSFEITGMDVAEHFFRNLASGIRAAADTVLLVGSPVSYAPVQEARRGYLAKALTAVERRIGPEVGEALPQGSQAVREALGDIGGDAVRVARAAAPVRTGNLRASIHSVRVR